MQATLDEKRDRVNEIELFFKSINELYDTQHTLQQEYTFHSDDFLKILKSNALIMIYNLVESSIIGGILEIYGELATNGYSYKDVTHEIQDVWFSYKFSQVFDRSAHFNSYKDKALEIISAIMSNEAICMDRKATDISGNLDADKIRIICADHGIRFTVDPNCKGGIALADVKEKRNNLSHGATSFVECGRDYTVQDLIKIKDQTISFLDGVLAGMYDYYQTKKYLGIQQPV